MKDLNRNPAKFELLNIYKAISLEERLSLTNEEAVRKFIERLEAEFRNAKDNPIVIQGLRTQAMFEYIIASLGSCVLIKAEDAGSVISRENDILPPDLRVVLKDGKEVLIEVKNYYQKDPLDPYTIRERYVKRLSNIPTKEIVTARGRSA
jgi:hypothetical protein